MKTYIVNRNNLKVVYELDTENGKTLISQKKTVYGTGTIVRIGLAKEVVAIFADAGKLYFQIGNRAWDISKFGLEFTNQKVPMLFGALRKFTVRDSRGNVLFSTLYMDRFLSNWKNWIDITYDEFDRQLDDIYLWLSEEVNSPGWKSELLKRWNAGVEVSE